MKFATAHKVVKSVGDRDGYSAHRDGNVTWCTVQGTISNVIVHESVGLAKAWMAAPTKGK